MLTIRLFRTGRRNQPSFKIVVTDKLRSSTRGRFVEEVGFYNPLTKQRNLKGDRVKYWISVGAKPSDTVHNMLVADKVIESQKLPKHKKSKKEQPVAEAEKSAESALPADAAPAQEIAPAPEEAPATEPATEPEKVPEATPDVPSVASAKEGVPEEAKPEEEKRE